MTKARRAEREAEDARESLTLMEEENKKLRALLRGARLRREELLGGEVDVR